MRPLTFFALAVVVCSGTMQALGQDRTTQSPTKYERVTKPMFDQLAAGCPAKHLEEMAPADLDLEIERFTPSLKTSQNKRFQALAKEECRNSFAGVGCGNVAFLEAAEKEGYLRRFTAYLCQSDLVCTDQAVCGPHKK